MPGLIKNAVKSFKISFLVNYLNQLKLEAVMIFKHPHEYGLMALVSREDYILLDKYRKKLDPLVKFYMRPDFFEGVAPQHISLCYFSYPDKYPEEFVEKLAPKINKIAAKFLPLKVKVQGLKGGWELGLGVPAIVWNIIDLKKISQFRAELVAELKKDIAHFNDPEVDFTPHIGIALGKEEETAKLKEIVEKSRNDKPVELTINEIFIFYPKGPKRIFEKRI